MAEALSKSAEAYISFKSSIYAGLIARIAHLKKKKTCAPLYILKKRAYKSYKISPKTISCNLPAFSQFSHPKKGHSLKTPPVNIMIFHK